MQPLTLLYIMISMVLVLIIEI